jgi:hypothetical protein
VLARLEACLRQAGHIGFTEGNPDEC